VLTVLEVLCTVGCKPPTIESLKQTQQRQTQQLAAAKRAYEAKDTLAYVTACLEANRAALSMQEDARTLLERGEILPDEFVEYSLPPGGILGAILDPPAHLVDPGWEARCREEHRDLWLDLMYNR
jgi:hypothetical protein